MSARHHRNSKTLSFVLTFTAVAGSNLICKYLLPAIILDGDMTKKLKLFFFSRILFPQKFKLCGDGDCPDYILAIIHANLCKMSSLKLKFFAAYVSKIVLSQEPIEEKKFMEIFGGSLSDSKSAYSCVRFLLLSAVRYEVPKDVFTIELQQLGLPREHAVALGKVLDEYSFDLRDHLKAQSVTVNELTEVTCKPSDGIDCVKVEMGIRNFKPTGGKVTKEVNIRKAHIPVMLKELKTIKGKMTN